MYYLYVNHVDLYNFLYLKHYWLSLLVSHWNVKGQQFFYLLELVHSH